MLTDNAGEGQEIYVPPQLIRVLKEYTKAVVRAKPSDLLLWSAEYFRNLASGQSPEKGRLHILDPSADGLSQAVIRLLYLKLKEKETVVGGDLKNLWNDLKLDSSLLLEVFKKSGVPQNEESEVNWMKMLALATAMISELSSFLVSFTINFLGQSLSATYSVCPGLLHLHEKKRYEHMAQNLKATMRKFLEVVGDTTSEPGMPLPAVEEIFQFLAEVDGVSCSSTEHALRHLREIGEKQGGFISSSDFQDAFPDV